MSKLRPFAVLLAVVAAAVTTAVVVQHPCGLKTPTEAPSTPEPAQEPEALDSSGGSAG